MVDQGYNSINDFGISLTGDPWTFVREAITAGAPVIEMCFFGTGKGSINNPGSVTPETIGYKKRQDIKYLAKVNGVRLTTHASANAMGLSGLGQDGFSQQRAMQNMTEVKRAINFAADTAEGGPIVVHTGEFPRAISEYEGFEAYAGEKDKALVQLVDKDSGRIIAGFPKDLEIPVLDTMYQNGKEVIDPATGFPIPKMDGGKYAYKKLKYSEFENSFEGGLEEAAKEFFRYYKSKSLQQASSEEKRWQGQAGDAKKQLDYVHRILKSVDDQAKVNPQMANYNAMKYAEEMRVAPRQGSPEYKDFLKNPRQFLQKGVDDIVSQHSYLSDASESYGKQRFEIETEMDGVRTINEYAIKKSAENIAELGIHAYEVAKEKGLERDLFVSPENIFTEHYGGHPQELKSLVEKSRYEMAKKLEGKGLEKDEAYTLAKKHIKATFDVGHANMWRQHYKGTDAEFEEWMLGQTKDLIDNDIVGHVHISDNFGYNDEHLTSGDGNAPIKKFVEQVKSSGKDIEMIIEPGAQGTGETVYSAMTETWDNQGARTYGGNVSTTWTDVEGSYFASTNNPGMMGGPYHPIQDKEELWWTGTPIE